MSKKLDRIVAAKGFRALVVAVVGVLIAAPAMAGNIYSWRTPSGDVAFTDDIKSVPARYRDQIKTSKTAPLGNYERFSAQDSAVAQNYQGQLAARLEYLRQLNAHLDQAAYEEPQMLGEATIRINGSSDQVLNITGTDYDAPVIVESIRVKRAGQIASRHDTVVRQGGRTLAILRGNQEGEVDHQTLDEQDVEFYR